MWLTGMRCAEVCALPLNSLPDDPGSVPKETVAIKITGKGQKRRAVLFPVRLLRSINRYIHMERRRHVSADTANPGTVFLGRAGRPLQTSAIERVFSTNRKRTGFEDYAAPAPPLFMPSSDWPISRTLAHPIR